MDSYVYSIDSLLRLSETIQKDSFSFPFLESFVGKYSQKVSEDRKTPLFSKTTKYNSFPVRCKWNNHEKKNKKETWRHSNTKHSIKNKPNVTKIYKREGIQGIVINVLNKLTKKNIDNISSILLDAIGNSKEENCLEIVANAILEKVWYDKGFYELYVILCKKIWEKNWDIPHTIHKKVNNYQIEEYYYSLYSNIKQYGPFKNIDTIKEHIKKNMNFKKIFISLCKNHFCKRYLYCKTLQDIKNSSEQFIYKRKIFGTVQILGYLYKYNHISQDIIHYILLSLLHSDSKTQKGCLYEEEMEAFKLLWDIVSNMFSKEEKEEYIQLCKKELPRWSPRTRFMIDDIISSCSTNTQKDSEKNILQKITKKIVPNLTQQDFTNIVSFSRKGNIDSISPLLQKSKIQEILIPIIQDIMEYHEYISNHIKLIDFCIKKYTIDQKTICSIFSKTCIELPDILIDAPRAKKNIQECIDFIYSIYKKDIEISYTEEPENIEEIQECIETLEHIFIGRQMIPQML